MTQPDGPVTDGAEPELPAEPPAGRLTRWFGAADQRSALRCVVALGIIALAAVAGAGLSLVSPPDVLPPQPYWLAVATVAVALSQVFMLRLRTTNGNFVIGWGETALVICLYAVPPHWIAAVIGSGAVLGHLGLRALGHVRTVSAAIRNAVIITVGGAAGMLAAGLVSRTYHARMTPSMSFALCLGAITYFAVTAVLAAATGKPYRPHRFRAGLVHIVRSKAVMVVCNIAIGVIVVAAIGADVWWGLLLPPALWLLQQMYAHRLRADEERRTWQAFAGATRSLSQLNERAVAVAGAEGAMELFSPRQAEVAVTTADNPRRYLIRRGGEVEELAATVDAAPDPVGLRSGDRVAVRELVMGGVAVGQLRLWFDGPGRLTPRQQMAFESFADALAAALHDAATHRQLQAITAQSTYDAAHDALTGLPNRATMQSWGDEVLRALDRDAPVALLLLDVDHFKEVNDTLGHGAGDDLLRITATRLGELASAGALLARLGGDEFALLLTVMPEDVGPHPVTGGASWRAAGPANDVTGSPLRRILRYARRVAEHLALPTEVAGVQLSIEASIGVVVTEAGCADMSELLRCADVAMYQAKRGGASVAWYDSAKDAASTDRLALLAELREALATTDQLVLDLQPAVDLVSGYPTGVEALIRWRHPRRGLLGPGEFVRVLEHSELLGPFTRYVIDRALGHASEWAANGLDVPVAVNMSPRSLLDPRLPADVNELLRRHRVTPRLLVLEITETVVLSELEVIDEVLAGLRDLGVQLAVDDFGTGYSSLTFLTRIPVDEVKVDRGFVADMVESPKAAAIVRTTVDLGRELGLRVVAEGVETAEQKAALAALGCTAAQGFHFYPPMPADKIGGVLAEMVAAAPPRVIPLRADDAS